MIHINLSVMFSVIYGDIDGASIGRCASSFSAFKFAISLPPRDILGVSEDIQRELKHPANWYTQLMQGYIFAIRTFHAIREVLNRVIRKSDGDPVTRRQIQGNGLSDEHSFNS
jgi:hypothetical protein